MEFEDFGEWQTAAGDYTTIGFTEIPVFSLVTTQYMDVGVTFVDGFYQTISSSSGFPQDGIGLDGNGPIYLEFGHDIYSVGSHFAGNIEIALYDDGVLVKLSKLFGIGGPDNFGGLVSEAPFNAAVIFDPFDDAPFLDNLYFGPSIPGPGALPLMALGLFCNRRRHR